MNILIFAGLSDEKLISKLSPIASLEKVKKLYLIRNTPLRYPKVRSLYPPSASRLFPIREAVKLFYGLCVGITKKVDCVMGIYLNPHGVLAHITGKILNIPVIQVFVGNDVDTIGKHQRIFKSLLKRAKFIGVRGSRSKKRLNEIIQQEEKFFIHHNVFNPPQTNVQISLPSKIFDIVCIADFSRVKRIDFFLKVIERIKERDPKIKAVIVGGKRGKRAYERMVSRMKLDENVSFAGKVPNVFPYLVKSKIFLLSSEAEGLPMSLVEAMSYGLPCVVPEVGDIGEIARDGYNAFVVKPLDEEGFARKALLLLKDRDMYQKMSRNTFHTIKIKERDFSLASIQKTWDKLLV
jgi:glycosyltransferase involved in cell wall biosynthesis